MADSGYKIRNQYAIHFLTFTVVSWVDIFTRKECRDILIDAFKYCIDQKGMLLYAFEIMSNHIHVIMAANENTRGLSALVGDFKKFTSKQLVAWVSNNPIESRQNWMLNIFQNYGQKNKRNEEFQVWIQSNHPEEITSVEFFCQKINYIHANPVKAGIVRTSVDYIYSSAGSYAGMDDNVLEVIVMDISGDIGRVN